MADKIHHPTMYGIKACDTVKKARAWLDERGIAYDFVDIKSAAMSPGALDAWEGAVGWEILLNKVGTTFRKLPDASKADLDRSKALALMRAQPSMIKRPVLVIGHKTLVGFKPDVYATALARA